MPSFLDILTEHIIGRELSLLEEACFVFPNRRTGLYLKKHLAAKLKKTMFSPAFYTIDDFICLLSGFTIADNITLLTTLYRAFKESNADSDKEIKPFDAFISWGQMMLNDFNDIDANLADPLQVFTVLTEAKAIAQWNPGNPVLTPFQKKYLDFYKSLGGIYEAFTKKLIQGKASYRGLILKYIIENNLLKNTPAPWKKIYFVGFNALTVAEEQLIDFYVKEGMGTLYLDYDIFYTENNLNEAGSHIRKAISKWGNSPFHEEFNTFKEQPKNIHIVGIPGYTGQAKMCGMLLQQWQLQINENNTVVVLPDETMLFPVLNALPDSVSHINVTMGYPFGRTITSDFFSTIINLFDNAIRLQKLKHDAPFRFNVKDILKISSHSLVCLLINDNEPQTSLLNELNREFKKSNKIFYTSQEWLSITSGALSHDHPFIDIVGIICTEPFNNALSLTAKFLEISTLFRKIFMSSNAKKRDAVEFEFLYHYSELLNKLHCFLKTLETTDVRTFRSIHGQMIKSFNVPFSGEPLKGLQVMGLLESRNLDFKNIIITSANEGILPRSKSQNSFIPLDIRRDFNLPVFYDNESIYAYHFYRLLQRAENIWVLYNTESDTFVSGEKSRFLAQMMYELKEVPCISFTEQILTYPFNTSTDNNSIVVEKTPEVLKLIEKKLMKGISPTSLFIYLQCPLRFYLQNMLGIKALETFEENMDDAQLGNVVHNTLEELYQKSLGRCLTDDLLTFDDNFIREQLINNFRKENKSIDLDHGKNHILYTIALKYIKQFIKEEKTFLQELLNKNESLHILNIELPLEKDITVLNEDVEYIVKLKGRIDRIDMVGSRLRIIDYKSGSLKDNDLKIKDWDIINHEKLSGKALQLLIYAYLYAGHAKQKDFMCGFISMRNPAQRFLPLVFPEGKNYFDSDVEAKTELFLDTVFQSFFNKENSFCQTDDESRCKYCDFKKLCNR